MEKITKYREKTNMSNPINWIASQGFLGNIRHKPRSYRSDDEKSWYSARYKAENSRDSFDRPETLKIAPKMAFSGRYENLVFISDSI